MPNQDWAPFDPEAGSPMKHFVFLFRQHPSTKLYDAEQKQRAEEVRAWAIRQNGEGRRLDPRLLVRESHRVNGEKAKIATDESVVVAITFLEARDFVEAVKIACSAAESGTNLALFACGGPRPVEPGGQVSWVAGH